MPPLFLAMAGGAIGAGLRYLVGRAAFLHLAPGWPWGTWMVNLVGGFCMGLLAGLLARSSGGGEQLRLFFGVGILGGFTTFSAFSLETFLMLERGDYPLAAAYVATSVAGAILALAGGMSLVRALA